MNESSRDFGPFVIALVKAGGWELQYARKEVLFAVLADGFGNQEAGVSLSFEQQGHRVKVSGVIERWKEFNIRQPFIFVYMDRDPMIAVYYITRDLLPRYQRAWLEAQAKIKL